MRPQIITEEEFAAMEQRVRGPKGREARHGTPAYTPNGRVTSAAVPGVRTATHAPSPFAPYVNKWELSYSKVLEMEQRVGAIKSWKYAGLTFTTAYRQYHRIDFIIGHNDHSIEIAQVKGYHPNMRAAMKGLKWAAQLYPMFTWTIKWWTGSGWNGKYVEI